jgi:hypothetical protein
MLREPSQNASRLRLDRTPVAEKVRSAWIDRYILGEGR